jgi:cyclohexadienyl dehydratase
LNTFFIFVFCLCSLSSAQSFLEDISKAKVISVGTTGDYDPFSFVSDKVEDPYNGLDIELAKDLAASMNVEVEFIHMTWGTLMDDLLQDKFDVGISGISINAAGEAKAMFSIPLMTDGKAAITRDENANKFNTIAAINQSESCLYVTWAALMMSLPTRTFQMPH